LGFNAEQTEQAERTTRRYAESQVLRPIISTKPQLSLFALR